MSRKTPKAHLLSSLFFVILVPLSRFFVQVVVIKYPQKDNTPVPVRGPRALVGLRVNRDAVSSVDPNRPSSWIIDDPLEMQPGVKGVFLKKG
jgi:hypothetical protein